MCLKPRADNGAMVRTVRAVESWCNLLTSCTNCLGVFVWEPQQLWNVCRSSIYIEHFLKFQQGSCAQMCTFFTQARLLPTPTYTCKTVRCACSATLSAVWGQVFGVPRIYHTQARWTWWQRGAQEQRIIYVDRGPLRVEKDWVREREKGKQHMHTARAQAFAVGTVFGWAWREQARTQTSSLITYGAGWYMGEPRSRTHFTVSNDVNMCTGSAPYWNLW